MAVGAEPRIVGQVPAIVVGIFVDCDLIGAPVPIVAEAVVSGSNAEGKSAEPEAFPIAAFNAPHVAAPEAAGKAAMFPSMIEMISELLVVQRAAQAGPVEDREREYGRGQRRELAEGLRVARLRAVFLAREQERNRSEALQERLEVISCEPPYLHNDLCCRETGAGNLAGGPVKRTTDKTQMRCRSCFHLSSDFSDEAHLNR
jgi:hypothetical protein